MRRRDGMLSRLNAEIRRQEVRQQQEAQRQLRLLELQHVTNRARAAEKNLKHVKAAVADLRCSSKARRASLDEAASQLLDKRKDKLQRYFPTHARVTHLTFSCLQCSLEEEWSAKVRQLLEVLPLRISALKSGPNTPLQVTVCDLQLPHGSVIPSDLNQKSEELDAALGYTLVLLELLGMYIGTPVLHQSSFNGSCSSLWRPRSFSDRRPISTGDVLPLHLGRTATAQLSASAWPSSSSVDQTLPHRQHQAEAAMHMLQRSIGAFAIDQLGPLGAKPPKAWSPFVTLAWICSKMARDSLRAAIQQLGSPGSQDGKPDSNGIGLEAKGASRIGSLEIAGLLLPDEDDDLVDADGWYTVPGTFLPPPPSQPDDVEHWTQAMLSEHKGGWQQALGLNVLRAWPGKPGAWLGG
ncbi:unnamed protein product [Ostreobium quekettii]|uniref:UV radiation resistance protein/autophagy-related protein 14 n=1 Tax=Ostreobium quekettii TaxID=121088 RepID=A0A8S1J2M0_9CHLO|nr:unnamed protein product [Ostreobium quekettii]